MLPNIFWTLAVYPVWSATIAHGLVTNRLEITTEQRREGRYGDVFHWHHAPSRTISLVSTLSQSNSGWNLSDKSSCCSLSSSASESSKTPQHRGWLLEIRQTFITKFQASFSNILERQFPVDVRLVNKGFGCAGRNFTHFHSRR